MHSYLSSSKRALRLFFLIPFALHVWASGAIADVVQFADPFTITGASSDSNINVNIPARQTGSLAGGTYTELLTSPTGYTNDAFIEKGSATFGGSDALLLRTYHGTASSATAVRLSTNFGPQVAGRKWRVAYTGNIQRNNATAVTDSWLSLDLGDTPGHTGPNNASTDIGFFIRGNGAWATWADNVNIASGATGVLKSPDIYATNWNLVLTIDETVSPIVATAAVTVAGGGTFNLGPWNVTWENAARYLEMRVLQSGNATGAGALCDARIENLTVSLVGDPLAPPVFVATPLPQTLWVGDSAGLTVNVESIAMPTYQWSLNNVAIPGATSSALNITNAAFENAGNYSVAVTNPNGTVTTSAVINVIYPNRWQRSAEPLAVSSKKTPLIFSEIMPNPAPRLDGRNVEFIELYNTNPWPEDLTGWRISGDIDFAFPPGTSIPALGFLVVAAAPSDVQTVYGLNGVLGPWTGTLSNNGGTLRLRRKNDAIVLDAIWNDGPDWPSAADGAGHSLVLARPSFGEADVKAWSASASIGGTPGVAENVSSSVQDHVLINEILAHSTVGTDFVELFNSSPLNVDVSGCWLSDDSAALAKFQIPGGTILPPRGRVSFSQTQMGFGLDAEGETIYFTNSTQTRVLDAVRFRGQLADTAAGRVPDGEGPVRRLSAATPGAANAAAARGPVVINELYFHPITGDTEDEWLELRNLSGSMVSLAGWRISDGVSYTFPAGASIAPNGYVVVARNPARVQPNHPALSPALIYGPFTGALADGGEEIVLAQPVVIPGLLTYFATVDEVNYADQSRWSQWADGGGSSLELTDAAESATPFWADSNESAKAPWTLVELTGVLDHVHTDVSAVANRIDAMLLNAGEALLDEVEAIPSGGGNQVINGGFESGIGAWLVQGTHNQSVIENTGFAGVNSLRIVAAGRGDLAPNRVRSALASTIAAGSTATIRARVRWLRGSDEFLIRFLGGGLEKYSRLVVPTNLGTPGAVNSRAISNAGPAITETRHRPSLPAANVPFTVSAKVGDATGLGAVSLRYRVDPSSTLTIVPMNDAGSGGDLLAGDGIFSCTIPGQPSSSLIGFTITAMDSTSASAVFPPTGECLVRVGDALPGGAFGSYSMWLTSAAMTAWNARLQKSNEDFPLTLLHNTSRIFYGSGAHFAMNFESANTNPLNTIGGYEISLPPGERLFGETSVTLDWPVRDATNQREQLMHWMLEQMHLPTLHRRDVHLIVNGNRRFNATVPIYHDAHQPGGSHLESNFAGDADGRLIKTNTWVEYNDTGTRLSGPINSLLPFTTAAGAYKTARYRWCWQPRADGRNQDDFTDLYGLVNAVNTTGNSYVGAVSGVADMEVWMRSFAFADLTCLWDTFGNENHKNAYLYKPANGLWQVIANDMDIGLGQDNGNRHPSSYALFPTGSIDPPLLTMYATPAFIRHYWRAISDSIGTFFSSSAVSTRISQRYNGYIANGVAVTSPFVSSGYYTAITGGIPEWMDLRVAFLQSQLATMSAPFSVNGPTTINTTTSPITLTGTAPVSVKTITFNGVEIPLIWTGTTTWSASVSIPGGTNPLSIRAFGSAGIETAGTTLSVTFTGSNAWGAIRINEWLADNAALVFDSADGDSEDWLELYNPTGANVSLANWSLSDSSPTPTTFVIPSGYSIPANGRIVVWADDETIQNTGSGQLHVPFKLSSGGETLTLRAPDGTVIDSVTFGAQVKNISQGRIPDGGATIDFLASASAGAVNSAMLATPTATATLSGGVVTFSITTTPDFTYQAQFKDDLDDDVWVNLGPPLKATSATLIITDTPGAQLRRFYRAVRTP